jgi:hypothetical protein
MKRVATIAKGRLALLLIVGVSLLWLGPSLPGVHAQDKAPAMGTAPAGGKPLTAREQEGVLARQTQEEGERILTEMMRKRAAVRAFTTRGQSIDDAPPFTTTERAEGLEFYPCSACHEGEVANRRVRALEEEHDTLIFEHGGGRFWCYDACHNPDDMDSLVSLRGKPIAFDQAYLLCGQCHFQRQKDYYFGGHGRRAGAWPIPREVPVTHEEMGVSEREALGSWKSGERHLQLCTDCHDAHSPSIKPYKPSPPPPVRRGLKRKTVEAVVNVPIWEELLHREGEGE